MNNPHMWKDETKELMKIASVCFIKELLPKCETYEDLLKRVKEYLSGLEKRKKEDPDTVNYIDIEIEESLNKVMEVLEEEEFDNLALYVNKDEFSEILKVRMAFGEKDAKK